MRTVGLKSARRGSSLVPKLESQLVTRHMSLVTGRVTSEYLERERESGQDADSDEGPPDCAPLLGSKLVTEEQGDACTQHRPGGRDQSNFRYSYVVFLHG